MKENKYIRFTINQLWNYDYSCYASVANGVWCCFVAWSESATLNSAEIILMLKKWKTNKEQLNSQFNEFYI